MTNHTADSFGELFRAAVATAPSLAEGQTWLARVNAGILIYGWSKSPAADTALLTVDVGNTNTVLGVWRGKELVRSWRLTTRRDDLTECVERQTPCRRA